MSDVITITLIKPKKKRAESIFAHDRRTRIVKYMFQFWMEHDMIYPSIRDIGEHTNITSTSVTNYYLDRLEKDGFVKHYPRLSRAIVLTDAGRRLAMELLGIDPEHRCPNCCATLLPHKQVVVVKSDITPMKSYSTKGKSIHARKIA